MRAYKLLLMLLAAAAFVTACGGGTSVTTDDDNLVNEGEDAPVTVVMQADYDGTRSRSSVATLYTQADCGAAVTDSPGFEAGTDCDSDGGAVAYADPTGFKVAIKRLALVMSDSTMVDLIPDSGTLADSAVVDLANPVQLDVSQIPQGTYTAFYAEFYYYDLTMPLYNDDSAQIRIYLSDDDFDAEGNLGNHQGDVKLMNASDVFQFVFPGVDWIDANLVDTRGAIVGSGGTDAETGHLRGLYGDADFWNTFEQGADQDIFIANDILSMTGVTVGSGGGEITITFDLTDSWFFEDFNSNGRFEPCINSSAEGCGGEWTPVFPGISFAFE